MSDISLSFAGAIRLPFYDICSIFKEESYRLCLFLRAGGDIVTVTGVCILAWTLYVTKGTVPANARRWNNVGLMLGRRHTSIKLTMAYRLNLYIIII